ncbi:hypothetical protein RvY_14046 [Ramazzottius varieornatus]|uniref:Uncharacterized protein n=1 Tax=Ramazzottius varieornatus TaxID=947166 RepID=A0A1D1VQ02_RAMVA|nr:hypothetical protein RvY_14046 [Ramazzottius varieornatus]
MAFPPVDASSHITKYPSFKSPTTTSNRPTRHIVFTDSRTVVTLGAEDKSKTRRKTNVKYFQYLRHFASQSLSDPNIVGALHTGVATVAKIPKGGLKDWADQYRQLVRSVQTRSNMVD